jgi:hypothetical protein
MTDRGVTPAPRHRPPRIGDDPAVVARWAATNHTDSPEHLLWMLGEAVLHQVDMRRRLGTAIQELEQAKDPGGREHCMQTILHLAKDLAL